MNRFLFFVFLLVTSLMFAQHQDKVDFLNAKINVQPMTGSKAVAGNVIYQFKVLENVDSVFLDAKNIEFKTVLLNNKKAKFYNSGQVVSIYKKFKKGRKYTLDLEYHAKPKQAVYFLGWEDDISSNDQVWTQGQGKYTSHWLPSLDDMTEKVEFDMDISFDASYGVIANGKLLNTKKTKGLKTWSFDMQKPMSSYLLAFAIGNYKKQELTSKSGIPIENYYYPSDSLHVEPTYRYTLNIFDFLEEEIGVLYPWQNYKQVPIRDFLYAGMENTGATLFSDAFVVDSIAFQDKNYVNVNAHELAHQWFGNLVTEKNGDYHWLHEGFATYYAYLAGKEIFGNDYFYWKLYDTANQLQKLSANQEGEALTNSKASSLTFYEKGAWALFILRAQIGDTAFKNGIKSYLDKYQFKNVTITNFIAEMESASNSDLSAYKESWLDSANFPFEKAIELLMANSRAIANFYDLKWELTTSLEKKTMVVQKYWEATNDEELKARIISTYFKLLSPELIEKAFDSQSVKIRQALALAYEKVPLNLKSEYESLLHDKSFVTVENALYRLWISFPQDRIQYLDITKGKMGLPNKNVRLLWLMLAILTKDYGGDQLKGQYMFELLSYTSPKYAMEIRQVAFGLIGGVFGFSDQNLLDLVNASVHHSWQFKKFARSLLDDLLKDETERKRLIVLSKELKEDELRYINTKLKME